MRMYAALVAWIVVSFLPALAGVWAKPDAWYRALTKPSWNPPNWIFGPVWSTLYLLMGIAAWLVWRLPSSPARTMALTAFGVQLALNALWSPLFFTVRRLDLALAEIVLMWIAILVTILLFWRVRPLAGGLLVPYILWVSFATFLNATLWRLNP